MSNSFTAHLLFNRPTILPTGKERVHRMGGKWVDEVAASSPDERAAIKCTNPDCCQPRTAWWYDVAKCVAQWNLRHNDNVTGLAPEKGLPE